MSAVWTLEQREAAAKALADRRCPDCGMKGQIGYAVVGPFRWMALHCAGCNGIYDMSGRIASWFWDVFFGRFWDGRVLIPCADHGGER